MKKSLVRYKCFDPFLFNFRGLGFASTVCQKIHMLMYLPHWSIHISSNAADVQNHNRRVLHRAPLGNSEYRITRSRFYDCVATRRHSLSVLSLTGSSRSHKPLSLAMCAANDKSLQPVSVESPNSYSTSRHCIVYIFFRFKWHQLPCAHFKIAVLHCQTLQGCGFINRTTSVFQYLLAESKNHFRQSQVQKLDARQCWRKMKSHQSIMIRCIMFWLNRIQEFFFFQICIVTGELWHELQ